MRRSSKTKEVENIKLTTREIEFLNLRKLSASYRDISDRLIKKKQAANLSTRGYSHESVRIGIKSALKKLNEHLSETAAEYRQLQIERLEGLLLANMRGGALGKTNPNTNEFIPPEVSRSKIALEIIRELSDTVGVKSPQKHEISGADGMSLTQPIADALSQFNKMLEKVYGEGENNSTE